MLGIDHEMDFLRPEDEEEVKSKNELIGENIKERQSASRRSERLERINHPNAAMASDSCLLRQERDPSHERMGAGEVGYGDYFGDNLK